MKYEYLMKSLALLYIPYYVVGEEKNNLITKARNNSNVEKKKSLHANHHLNTRGMS